MHTSAQRTAPHPPSHHHHHHHRNNNSNHNGERNTASVPPLSTADARDTADGEGGRYSGEYRRLVFSENGDPFLDPGGLEEDDSGEGRGREGGGVLWSSGTQLFRGDGTDGRRLGARKPARAVTTTTRNGNNTEGGNGCCYPSLPDTPHHQQQPQPHPFDISASALHLTLTGSHRHLAQALLLGDTSSSGNGGPSGAHTGSLTRAEADATAVKRGTHISLASTLGTSSFLPRVLRGESNKEACVDFNDTIGRRDNIFPSEEDAQQRGAGGGGHPMSAAASQSSRPSFLPASTGLRDLKATLLSLSELHPAPPPTASARQREGEGGAASDCLVGDVSLRTQTALVRLYNNRGAAEREAAGQQQRQAATRKEKPRGSSCVGDAQGQGPPMKRSQPPASSSEQTKPTPDGCHNGAIADEMTDSLYGGKESSDGDGDGDAALMGGHATRLPEPISSHEPLTVASLTRRFGPPVLLSSVALSPAQGVAAAEDVCSICSLCSSATLLRGTSVPTEIPAHGRPKTTTKEAAAAAARQERMANMRTYYALLGTPDTVESANAEKTAERKAAMEGTGRGQTPSTARSTTTTTTITLRHALHTRRQFLDHCAHQRPADEKLLSKVRQWCDRTHLVPLPTPVDGGSGGDGGGGNVPFCGDAGVVSDWARASAVSPSPEAPDKRKKQRAARPLTPMYEEDPVLAHEQLMAEAQEDEHAVRRRNTLAHQKRGDLLAHHQAQHGEASEQLQRRGEKRKEVTGHGSALPWYDSDSDSRSGRTSFATAAAARSSLMPGKVGTAMVAPDGQLLGHRTLCSRFDTFGDSDEVDGGERSESAYAAAAAGASFLMCAEAAAAGEQDASLARRGVDSRAAVRLSVRPALRRFLRRHSPDPSQTTATPAPGGPNDSTSVDGVAASRPSSLASAWNAQQQQPGRREEQRRIASFASARSDSKSDRSLRDDVTAHSPVATNHPNNNNSNSNRNHGSERRQARVADSAVGVAASSSPLAEGNASSVLTPVERDLLDFVRHTVLLVGETNPLVSRVAMWDYLLRPNVTGQAATPPPPPHSLARGAAARKTANSSGGSAEGGGEGRAIASEQGPLGEEEEGERGEAPVAGDADPSKESGICVAAPCGTPAPQDSEKSGGPAARTITGEGPRPPSSASRGEGEANHHHPGGMVAKARPTQPSTKEHGSSGAESKCAEELVAELYLDTAFQARNLCQVRVAHELLHSAVGKQEKRASSSECGVAATAAVDLPFATTAVPPALPLRLHVRVPRGDGSPAMPAEQEGPRELLVDVDAVDLVRRLPPNVIRFIGSRQQEPHATAGRRRRGSNTTATEASESAARPSIMLRGKRGFRSGDFRSGHYHSHQRGGGGGEEEARRTGPSASSPVGSGLPGVAPCKPL